MGNNNNKIWFRFVNYILDRSEHLQVEERMRTKLFQLISGFITPQISHIVNESDIEIIYSLLTKNGILDKQMERCILQNEHLMKQLRFIPFVSHLLQTDEDVVSKNLLQCVEIWIKTHGFKVTIDLMNTYSFNWNAFDEYCLNCQTQEQIILITNELLHFKS